jgi:glycosyltransferase involved in cell wall biosynthesis
MKILMIAPQPFFEPRGTPISVFQRLHGLSELGHEVDVVTYHVGNNVDIPNVHIHRTLPLPFIKKVKIGPSPAKIPLDFLVSILIVWMLVTRRYDVIHTHEEAGFMVMFLAKLLGKPHVYDMHSSLPKQLGNFSFGNNALMKGSFSVLENMLIRLADVVLTIGKDLEEHVYSVKPNANQYRIENMAIQNILPVDHDKAKQTRIDLGIDDKVVLVYTGTLETYQGLDLLYDAVKIARTKTETPFALVMAGGKPEQVAEQKGEVARRDLSEDVIFVGQVPLQDSLYYLDMADILVSPRSSGLSVPLKVYTYLQSGRAMVATNIPAHTIVLTDETAVLADPNPEAYAEGLVKAIDDPVYREKVAQGGLAYAEEELSKARYVERLRAAYQSITPQAATESPAVS